MELASQGGSYDAAALETLLTTVPTLPMFPLLDVPGVPAQAEIDRLLSSYEAWVYVDDGSGGEAGSSVHEATGREVLV
jgi:hypothetical protein